MLKEKFYITSPIYYVNDVPHIGHAYTNLVCDVLARFMKMSGKDVWYLTGTDEHGLKVQESALNNNLSPKEFSKKMSLKFKSLLKTLNVTNSDFIRTSEKRHRIGVETFWNKLYQSGNIYLGKYSGWYSLRDETFYSQSEISAEGLAPTGAPVEWLEEPSYFFTLSKWESKLLSFYDKNPEFITPKSKKNEVINFVKSGLRDLSVSRTNLKWGIPVPQNKKHIIYVWFDALINYISALGYPATSNNNYSKFWPADVHVLGKDILKFHAVYWPALLMAAELPLPKKIIAHGWWTNEGQKISKSLNNLINPFELVKNFGLDQVRYFLVREIILGNDGNYTDNNLVERTNSELSNKIGNLVQRTCAFLFKNCGKKIPNITEEFINNLYNKDTFFVKLKKIVKDIILQVENYNLNGILSYIIYIAEELNVYIDREAPWILKESNPLQMNEVMYKAVEIVRYIGILMQPFTPDSAKRILDQISIPKEDRALKHLSREFAIKPSTRIKKPLPIFPRLFKTESQ